MTDNETVLATSPGSWTPPPLTPELEAEIRERAAVISPGPWQIEKSLVDEYLSVHWSIRTRDSLPEHPWSARYIAWLCGMLKEYVIPSDRPNAKFCDACRRMVYRGREVGVDVRDDPQVEADAQFMAHAWADVPTLLTAVDAFRAQVKGYEATHANYSANVAIQARSLAEAHEELARREREIDRLAACLAATSMQLGETQAERDRLLRDYWSPEPGHWYVEVHDAGRSMTRVGPVETSIDAGRLRVALQMARDEAVTAVRAAYKVDGMCPESRRHVDHDGTCHYLPAPYDVVMAVLDVVGQKLADQTSSSGVDCPGCSCSGDPEAEHGCNQGDPACRHNDAPAEGGDAP